MDKANCHQSQNQSQNKFAKSKVELEKEYLSDFTKKIHEIEGKLKAAIKPSTENCETDSESDECCYNYKYGKDFAENLSKIHFKAASDIPECKNIGSSQNVKKQKKRKKTKPSSSSSSSLSLVLVQQQQQAAEKQLNAIQPGNSADTDNEYDDKDYENEFGNETESSDIDIESIMEDEHYRKSKSRKAAAQKQHQEYLANIYAVEEKLRAAMTNDGSNTDEQNKTNEHKSKYMDMKTKEELEEEKRQAYEAQILADEEKLKAAIDPIKDDYETDTDTDCDECSYDYEYEYDYEDEYDQLIESSDKDADDENLANN